MEDIVIIGYGGFAREVAFLIEEINKNSPTWNILGFAAERKEKVGLRVGKYQVYCSDEDLSEMRVATVIGIGSPRLIRKIAERITGHEKLTFPNLVHPSTIWDKERIALGCGNIICAGSIFTTDISIGSFNIFNANNTYGHDVRVGDYCVINPGCKISGNDVIGSSCLIGVGATILESVTIGDNATVGIGAVVLRDVRPSTTVLGNPARPIITAGPDEGGK